MTHDANSHGPSNDPTGTPDQRIERGMRELATWPASGTGAATSEATPLWQLALAQVGGRSEDRGGASRGTGGRIHDGRIRAFAQRLPRRGLAIAACVMLLVVGAGVLLPALGKARSRAPAVAEAYLADRAEVSMGRKVMLGFEGRQFAGEEVAGFVLGDKRMPSAGVSNDATRLREELQGLTRGQSDDRAPADVGAISRQVVRNAVMAIEAPDVAATVSRVTAIASEVHAEYVERSSIAGEGKEARAEVVLRVAASRLDQALASLRLLGKVTAETVSGEDVTAQVVDVEARLHNERRVETELLDLFDKRADAPLRDVLDLRDKLREVRLEIEQLQAQRDRLARLVALSTVTVSVQAVAEEEKEAGFFQPLSSRIARSWDDGLSGLNDSIAWVVRVAVGGLVWWVAIALAVLAWRRWVRVKHLPA